MGWLRAGVVGVIGVIGNADTTLPLAFDTPANMYSSKLMMK